LIGPAFLVPGLTLNDVLKPNEKVPDFTLVRHLVNLTSVEKVWFVDHETAPSGIVL